jgi:hypothetical protein
MVGFVMALSDLHAAFASESPTCRSDPYYAGSLLSPSKSICSVSLHRFLIGSVARLSFVLQNANGVVGYD